MTCLMGGSLYRLHLSSKVTSRPTNMTCLWWSYEKRRSVTFWFWDVITSPTNQRTPMASQLFQLTPNHPTLGNELSENLIDENCLHIHVQVEQRRVASPIWRSTHVACSPDCQLEYISLCFEYVTAATSDLINAIMPWLACDLCNLLITSDSDVSLFLTDQIHRAVKIT